MPDGVPRSYVRRSFNTVTGRSDGQALLEYLERANLFLIPLIFQHEWFRYHNLFGDVLRKVLGQKYPDTRTRVAQAGQRLVRGTSASREAITHALAIPVLSSVLQT